MKPALELAKDIVRSTYISPQHQQGFVGQNDQLVNAIADAITARDEEWAAKTSSDDNGE